MNKNLSISNSDIWLLIKRSLFFIIIVIACNFFLLMLVILAPNKYVSAKPKRIEKSVVVFGSSNVDYGIDYNRIQNSIELSEVEPAGLFIAMMTLEKLLQKNDVVICDLPYSWYSLDDFCPATYFFYKGINLEGYMKLAEQYPVLFIKHVLASDPVNTSLWEYLYGAFIHRYVAVSPSVRAYRAVNTVEYSSCDNKYIKENHFVFQTQYSENHIQIIKNSFLKIGTEKKIKIYFKYPELNKGNYYINPHLIQSIENNFKPINSFEEWPDSLMYDQWYHLNYCGRQLNTNNIIQFLQKNNYM